MRCIGRSALALVLALAVGSGCKGSTPSSDGGLDAAPDAGELGVHDVSVDAPARDMLPLDAPLSLPAVSLCSGGGWCVRHPLPYPTTIVGMWTRPATPPLLYLANESGALLTYDGTSYKRFSSGITASFVGVWGRGASELYGAANYSGYGRVRRYDGSAWAEVFRTKSGGNVSAIAGNDSAVYATIYQDLASRIARDNGSGWALTHTAPNTSVRYQNLWVDAGGRVVAVGTAGAISVYDGSAWSEQTTNTVNSLYGVWSDGSATFVVGSNGTVLRQSAPGGPWEPMATATSATLRAVYGRSASEVYAVGELYSSLGSRQRYTILRFDGKAWSAVHDGAPATATSTSVDLRAIAERDGELFAGGRLGALVSSSDGINWRRVSSRATDVSLQAAWTDGSKVVVGGQLGRLMQKTADDKWVEIVLDLPFTVQALWGQGSVLFAAGSGAMFRFDGASWQAVPAGDNTINVLGLWGSAPDDVYGVGGNGIILHYDGNALTPMASGTSLNLRGVWGASKSAIFAAGGNAVLRYDGTQWNTLEVGPIDHSYYAVWGSSASDVYVVGRDDNAKKALVRHYDGAQWSDTTIDEDAVLTGVSGNSATDINAVGSAGFAVHFDGATWTKVNTAVPWTLTAIACGAPQGCFAVSSSAVVLQRAPTTP